MKRSAGWLALCSALLLIAFGAGYLVSTGAGREFIRIEAERFLGDLLDGEVHIDEVELVLSRGLALRGLGVSVYPGDGGPGMHADVVTIEFGERSLLLGDLELAVLEIDGLLIRANLLADGSWTYPPLQSLQNRTVTTDGDLEDGSETEPVLKALAGAETVGRYILEKEPIAARLVIHNGQVLFEDYSLIADTRPELGLQRFQLQRIEASVSRPWLSDEAAFALSGTFVGPGGRSCAVTWTGSLQDGEVKLVLEVAGLDLDGLDGYVQRVSRDADIEGSLQGSVTLETAEPGFQHVAIEADLARLAPTVVVDGKPIHIDLPGARLHARLEVEPDAARVLDAELSGPEMGLRIEGQFERPVGRNSKAHFEVEIHGVAVEHAGPIVEQLPEESSDTMREWFGRLKSGTVERLAISGTTLLSTWEALAGGELSRLPRNFLLRLDVADVAVALAEDDEILGATFAASWAADRLEIRNADGTWRGEDLPEISVTVDGVSRLIDMREFEGEANAAPTPGLAFLWELLFAGDEEPDESAHPRRFLVDIDYLDHPILRWPIESAQVIVEPTPHGSESQVTSALWGGKPVVAEVLYQLQPTERITVGLAALPALDGDDGPQRVPRDAEVWGRARFSLEPIENITRSETGETGLLSRMSGDIALHGASADLSNVELTLSSATTISTDVAVDLAMADRLGLRANGRLDDSSCDDLGQVIGLPEGFITGTLDVIANVEGEIVRGRGLFDGLEGPISVSAEKGEIQQSIPLAVALATATDGFNPFAERKSLVYETIQADILLSDGKLIAERLELEGPVRVYATGSLDFAEPPLEVDAVVGIFLLQRIREFLDKVPIVNLVLPGSKKGFVGAYMRVSGPWDDPKVTTMAMKSLREELPDLITKPFDLIQWLWSSSPSESPGSKQDAPPAAGKAISQTKPGASATSAAP